MRWIERCRARGRASALILRSLATANLSSSQNAQICSITLPGWTFAWPLLSHPPPSCVCNGGGQYRVTYWTEWLAVFLWMSPQCMLLTVLRKRRSSIRSDPAPPHLPLLSSSLQPFQHPHSCLFPAITIIPVICVTQSSKPVIFREKACCEGDLKMIPPHASFSWRPQFIK